MENEQFDKLMRIKFTLTCSEVLLIETALQELKFTLSKSSQDTESFDRMIDDLAAKLQLSRK